MKRIEEYVRDNQGFFSRGEAVRCGETDMSLRSAVRAGLFVRLTHGMYAPAELVPADPLARHLLLARASMARQKGEVALTGPSAAALHGFAVYGHDLSLVHLVRLDGGAGRRQAGINHHQVDAPIRDDVGEFGGLLATTPARTVWEVARLSSLESGVVTADSALHKDPSLIDPIREMTEKFTFYSMGRVARRVVQLARAGADSPGESVTRVQFYRYGLPEPELQLHVFDDNGQLIGISDFGWELYRHLAEFDGRVKYERLLRPGENVTDCVLREKRREDRMRATRRGMSRLIWSEVMPDTARASMRELGAALDTSRQLHTHNRVVMV